MKISYFSFSEWLLILIFALGGALMNSFLPLRAFLEELNMTGPVKGMVLFGGFFFVMWVYLGRKITGKRYAGLATAILLISFCLIMSPWYGVLSPSWFSLYGLFALIVLGICVEFLNGKWDWIGGGIGNLFCLLITWFAFGFHLNIWPEPKKAPVPLFAAFISGVLGVLCARIAVDWITGKLNKKRLESL
jgi:general stress protein CsbA